MTKPAQNPENKTIAAARANGLRAAIKCCPFVFPAPPPSMPFGFYIIMAAQFFSALADNTLLIVAIELLRIAESGDEMEPLLRLVFTLSYVLLAPFVGSFADSMPKARVMFISNGVKILGCALLITTVPPLLAYAIIGLGATAYSPAKYGILTEYLPHSRLVRANGWIEGLTVGAIILGAVLGGFMVAPATVQWLQWQSAPHPLSLIILLIGLFYVLAAIFNLFIPHTGVPDKPIEHSPWEMITRFADCVGALWKDPLGQISLAVTTLFWGAGATLQFIIIKWAENELDMGLSNASMLQGVVALGVALGAALAARMVSLFNAVRVIPLGLLMGVLVMLQVFVHTLVPAVIMMVLVGMCAGFFVVPMNALLQHRGHLLIGAGHSIAVQNFNENLSILFMLSAYALLLYAEVSINTALIIFGLFVALTMALVWLRYRANQRRHDSRASLREYS